MKEVNDGRMESYKGEVKRQKRSTEGRWEEREVGEEGM